MAQPKPPTVEQGHGGVSIIPWSGLSDPSIDVPELVWPQSILTFDHMRRDSQIAALLWAITMPIRRYKWMINPNGARDEVVQYVSDDLNVPIAGTDPTSRPRQRDRFSHDTHLHHAFLALVFGHMYFEQKARLDDKGMFHLEKLGPRMPATIARVNVTRTGGLAGIEQFSDGTNIFGTKQNRTPSNYGPMAVGTNIPIEVSRLAAYIHEREGGNWFGRSVLVPAYKNWLLKDRLLRVDGLKNERNGMGIPDYEAPPGASDTVMKDLAEKAARIRVGTYSGGSSPHGAKLRMVGVEGSLPDTIASIRYHDEQMARLVLAMFMQLGTTASGSRALGTAMIDFFGLSQQAYATWYTDVTNQHVIEDMIDWNWGIDENAPLLMYVPNDDAALAVADLVTLIQSGALVVDNELEGYIRQRWNLPDAAGDAGARPPVTLPTANPTTPATPTTTPTVTPAPASPAVAAGGRHRRQIKASRREPTTEESASGANFDSLLGVVEQGQADLVAAWDGVRVQAVEVLLPELQAALMTGGVAELANVQLDLAGVLVDATAPVAQAIATAGITHAVAEAASQGVTLTETLLAEATIALLNEHLAVVEGLLEQGLVLSATREAARRAGLATAPDVIVTEVQSYLDTLTDAYAEDVLGGTAATAMNAGRHQVFDGGPVGKFYASEINDTNTCKPCKEIDTQRFDTLAALMEHYPTGGYVDCLGRDRCRGTFVAVYEATDSAVDTPVAQPAEPAVPVAARR